MAASRYDNGACSNIAGSTGLPKPDSLLWRWFCGTNNSLITIAYASLPLLSLFVFHVACHLVCRLA
jgi:hypothetical protein